jgi:hypothetical protein
MGNVTSKVQIQKRHYLVVVLIFLYDIYHLYYVDAAVGTQVGHLAQLTPEIVRNDNVIPKIYVDDDLRSQNLEITFILQGLTNSRGKH